MRSWVRGVGLLFLGVLAGNAQVNILTANGDNNRTNSNLQETRLSPATVNSFAFGKLGTLPTDGQVYSQPLYVSGLTISGRARNVVFVASMHNTVYAYDADAMTPVSELWRVNLGPSVPASLLFGQYGDIALEVGILGTGAIDLQRRVLYVVADVLERGRPAFYLHALDLTSGAERLNGPVALSFSAAGGALAFDPLQHIQRPGLLLANNAVYVSFGSHGDQEPYHGWMVSYDAADISRQLGVYVSTPKGSGGAIWQSGRGPAADAQGNIYAITGNGDYDGVDNFGQSFIKLAPNGTTVADSFTPDNWKSMSDNDFDLSGGPALIPGTHTVIGADKGGNLYVVNGDAMRRTENATIMAATPGSIFNFAIWGRVGSANIYVQGGKDQLKAFQLTGNTLDPTPLSATVDTLEYARIGVTLSANGAQSGTGILWEGSGDYSDPEAPGILHAYDASNLAIELWNSEANPERDRMPPVTKFAPPTVANGKVYVPSTANVVTVYGAFSEGDGTTLPSIAAVANAASYSQDAVSPGELISIFGDNLGPDVAAGLRLDASGLVATELGGVQVMFDGVASPMIFAGASQVNAAVPFGVAGSTTQIQVVYEGRASDAFTANVAPANYGIFTADASGTGQAVVLNQDGGLNSPNNPAARGSVVTLWGTGGGQLSPTGVDGGVVSADNLPVPSLPVEAQIAGNSADVLYAGGAPGMIQGVLQVNLRIPSSAPSGPTVPLMLKIGTSASQPGITIAVR